MSARTENPDMPLLLTTREVGRLLQVSESTLSRWRRGGGGPNWINLAGMPRYQLADVERFIKEGRR